MNDEQHHMLNKGHTKMRRSYCKGLSRLAVFLGTVAALVLTLPRESLADLPRPPGWEPSCTVEKELAKGGGPCEDARGWQNPDPRQEAFAAKGYTRRCTEGGAGSYVAVWCKSPAGTTDAAPTPPTTGTATNTPPGPPTVTPAADNRKSGGLCSASGIGQDKHGAFFAALGVVLAGFGVARRRAARRKAHR